MIAKPTVTSAAATTMIKNTKSWASVPTVVAWFSAYAFKWCILENATNNKFTAFSINSMHMKMMIALRLVNTPTMPMAKSATDKNI
jgi:hypothetical protein